MIRKIMTCVQMLTYGDSPNSSGNDNNVFVCGTAHGDTQYIVNKQKKNY